MRTLANEPQVAVVGSGPSGIACAKALVRRGVRVVLLDVGDQLDARRQSLVDRLGAQDHKQWSAPDRQTLTENPTVFGRGVPKKLVFGSDYIYARNDQRAPIVAEPSVAAVPTLACGGFSMAWGGAMLPTAECDMVDWPFGRARLEPAYRQVLADLPFSAVHDGLESEFPLYREPDRAIRLPRQAAAFAADFAHHPPSGSGGDTILCGQSRLALRAADAAMGQGCRYCGLCLNGCVYHSIHTFDRDLRRMVADGSIEYRPGVVVRHLVEEATGVRVHWLSPATHTAGSESFARLFLAAGALNSARILLESMGRYDTPVTFLDSQKFIVPLVRWQSSPIEWPDVNTLPSLFLEARLPSISPHWVHMQVSTMNNFVLGRFGLQEPGGTRWQWLRFGLERLMIAWCGLHSSLSNGFVASLRKADDDGPGAMILTQVRNPATEPTIHRTVRRMMAKSLRGRTLVLPMVTISDIGGGNHFGGAFPMRETPGMFNHTDLLGRPSGWERVHLVDGAVLPSIPATTVALPMMANAYRIATDAPI
ncbi:MAG: NAD(P)-binding protein [Alphaproteobacteria bacterium]|nr:NAD(P)-binding protein [Alphaproteobacteria bacterium]